MVGRYKVITLCGSTRFKNEFMQVQKELTLKGYIVISVGLFGHSGDEEVWTEGAKEMLDDMHKRKIDMADEIFVINKNGYIGESTKREIKYAIAVGKPVRYLEKEKGKIFELIEWLEGRKYLIDEHSTTTTEEFEEKYKWELSRNTIINEIIQKITEMSSK